MRCGAFAIPQSTNCACTRSDGGMVRPNVAINKRLLEGSPMNAIPGAPIIPWTGP